jgi:hypothetical protein
VSGRTPRALYQVDDSTYTGLQPLYKLVMIESERAELAAIPGISSSWGPDSQMNGTFISITGTGTECRYLCGFRNRGHGSRRANPPNYRVNIPNDRLWQGRRALNLNSTGRYVHVLGAALSKKSGGAGAAVWAAQVRVNNQNRANQTGSGMFGSYAACDEYDNTWAERQFPQDSEGNIYKVVRDLPPSPDPRFNYRGEDPAPYRRTYVKQSNTSADDWSDLIAMLRVMGTDNPDPFRSEDAAEVVNVEQWLLHLALMNLMGNAESGLNTGNNDDYYLYRGESDPRFIMMYHDLDQILGYNSLSPSTNIFRATCCPVSGDTEGTWRAMDRFMHWPDIEPVYYRTLQRLLDTTFAEEPFNALVDQTFSTYAQSSQLTGAIANIKSWMASQRALVQSFINGRVPPAPAVPATISGEPRSPTPFTTATLTVGGAGVTHYKYRLNNGTLSAERPVSTPITLSGLANNSTNRVMVVGRNAAGTYQTYFTTSKSWVVRTATPTVRLNEVLARNVAAVNHAGTYPDLVELYNEGAATVDLSGLRLTDDPANPGQFIFPPGATLDAGQYLVLYANEPDGTPGLHLGFALNQDGEGLYLFDRVANGGALLDSVAFGRQLPDLSIGRVGPGGEWYLGLPTFGATNVAQPLGNPAGVRLNEWLASGTLPFTQDFIELFNPDPLPVALDRLYLTDEPIGAPTRHRIADYSFVAGGGLAVFFADGNPGAGSNHLGFRLSAELGWIGLLGADLAWLDAVGYPPQTTGLSQGRCADGQARIVFLEFPTPGSPNACPTPPVAPQLVNVLPVTQDWKYNQSGLNLGTNWKEPGYDDSTWPAGPGVLGVLRAGGTLPEPVRTPLQVGGRTTYYFRTRFTPPPGANYTSLQISNIVDDGAVFYLNGAEFARFNLPAGTITHTTLASANILDAVWEGPIAVPTNLVRTGENLLAVEVHQASTSSADIHLGLRLDGVQGTVSAQAAGVVLNEVLANNATLTTPDGATPDWVEVFNPSTNTVDLGNMSLSDSTLNPRRWVFPSPTLLPPRGYWVVRCDSGAPASAQNTGFGLKATGDAIYLFNPNATVRDWITFGLQAADFSIGRVPDGTGHWGLTLPSAGLSNTAALLGNPLALKVNEWMALPDSGEDWFEIYNPDGQPVALGGLGLSDDLSSPASRLKSRIPALSFVGALTNGYQQFRADGNLAAGADHTNFKLDGTVGEDLGISLPDGTLIDGIRFSAQEIGVSAGRLPDGHTNVTRFPGTASPGEGNYNLLADVVISEVLAHTDLPLEDAIELQNLGPAPVDLSGWFLSDSQNNLQKFLLPEATVLAPGGFAVFYEYQFNNPEFLATAFALSSAKGDQVILSEAVQGQLTGRRAEVKFGPSANGVAFGRYQTSVGVDFVALSALSLGTEVTAQSPTNQITLFRTGQGATNADPLVGPVIISQIMYHPPDLLSGGVTNDNVIEEFVELRNISSQPVPLFDPAHPTNGWRLREGVDFDFNASHVLPPGGFLQVVSFDPLTNLAALAQFRARYGSNSSLVGPYRGKLDNGGERLELKWPDTPAEDGTVPYVLAEKVVYDDRFPWPTEADGQGASLQRVSATGYANDPTNWLAALPTLGLPGLVDTDGDGLPDSWETQYGFDKNNPADAAEDADDDGLTNLEEYLCATHPRDPLSYLKVECAYESSGQIVLRFLAVEGKTYTLLYRDAAEGGAWQRLADLGAQPTTHIVTVPDPTAETVLQRFYRLATPVLP